MSAWPPERIDRLLALARTPSDLGRYPTASDLGRRMGCSRNAVIGILTRLNISLPRLQRDHAEKRDAQPVPERKPEPEAEPEPVRVPQPAPEKAFGICRWGNCGETRLRPYEFCGVHQPIVSEARKRA